MENTKWQIGIEPGNKAVLSYTKVDSGGNPIGGPTPFKIKGICYSPCPIGEDNRVGNNLGDYFWDSFTVGANNEVHIWNWDRLWKPNYDSFGSRNDLDKLAALGINTIRVYSMMAYQMPDPNHFDFSHEFTHSSFLDECYACFMSKKSLVFPVDPFADFGNRELMAHGKFPCPRRLDDRA